jgi:hypothetical protein
MIDVPEPCSGIRKNSDVLGQVATAVNAQQPKCQSTGLLVLTRGFVAWWLRLLADSCSAREASGLRSGIRKNSDVVRQRQVG